MISTEEFAKIKNERSPLEELMRSMILITGLPIPLEEYQFDEKRRWRFDFAWPEKMIACEVDGGTWLPNGGRHARREDYQKRNAATLLKWRVFYFTGEQVKDGEAVNFLKLALYSL